MERFLLVPPLVLAPLAPSFNLSGPALQLGIPTMPQSRPVSPIVSSSIPVYVSTQCGKHHLTFASQFVLSHSLAHHHLTSAPANQARPENIVTAMYGVTLLTWQSAF